MVADIYTTATPGSNCPRTPSRRGLFAGGAAFATTIAAAAPAATATSSTDDAALIRTVEHFKFCHARVLEQEVGDHAWEDVEDAARAWNDAVDDLCAMPPRTAAGLAAKASALVMALRAGVGDFTKPEEAFYESAQPHDRLAMVFAREVMALAERKA